MSAATTGNIILHGIRWDTYQRLREDLGPGKRLTYDRGTLEIMSPRYIHEGSKKLLDRLIELVAEHHGIEMIPAGSTTFGSSELDKGLEPDECYYIQHRDAIHGIEDIDLQIHPPPDLAVEVDITSWSKNRLPLCASIGVPEVWRYDGRDLLFLLLTDGGYQRIEPALEASQHEDRAANDRRDSDSARQSRTDLEPEDLPLAEMLEPWAINIASATRNAVRKIHSPQRTRSSALTPSPPAAAARPRPPGAAAVGRPAACRPGT